MNPIKTESANEREWTQIVQNQEAAVSRRKSDGQLRSFCNTITIRVHSRSFADRVRFTG